MFSASDRIKAQARERIAKQIEERKDLHTMFARVDPFYKPEEDMIMIRLKQTYEHRFWDTDYEILAKLLMKGVFYDIKNLHVNQK